MMIDMQKMVKDIKKIAEVANMTITEIEGSILMASINNRTTNVMNILEILESLQYLIQSDIEDQTFQIQRILANKLDRYKERGNSYVDDHIQEIQELYKKEEMKKKKERIEDKEVILIKPYKVDSSTSSSTQSSSFINEEIDNLLKYMKFVKSPTQTRIFRLLPHYQLL